jgi:hypothetical protein
MTRDVHRAIEHVERVMAHALESRAKSPKKETIKSSTIRAWRAPPSNSQYPEPKTRQEGINVTKLAVTARAMKVMVPLDAAMVGALPEPNQERVELAVNCDGLGYVASISAKSLRKALNTINTNGADAVFVMLQGRLRGNTIIECGLTAQVKAKAPPNEPVESAAHHLGGARNE